MLRLIGLVVSIGLADSLNPGTVAPAMYLATRERARANVTEFTLGVFVVYFAGGALIALGPGQLLLSLVPKPHANARHVIEIAVGVAMIVASGLLWRYRKALAKQDMPKPPKKERSSVLLGAGITAVELPTAFPYFAAIAAIVGSGLGILNQIILLLLFNFCFVLPLIAMAVTLTVAGERAQPTLKRWRDFLQRRWPVLLSALLLVAGLFIVALGATAVTGRIHGRFGHFSRRLHHFIHP